jgi:transglutaminase-like putative cysteine protease
VIVSTTQVSAAPDAASGPDEALSTRLRDLALVELDALTAGLDGAAAQPLIAAFADDVADALREARARIVALRQIFGGPDPLNILETTPRQRASDAGLAGAERVRGRLVAQAEAGRALARLAELAAGLVPKLFEADRRR